MKEIINELEKPKDKPDIEYKMNKLLFFVKGLVKRSCCNVCDCIACDALFFLREIGEDPYD